MGMRGRGDSSYLSKSKVLCLVPTELVKFIVVFALALNERPGLEVTAVK